LKRAFEQHPTEYCNVECLWKAYKPNGDYDGAIKTLENTLNRRHHLGLANGWVMWDFLARAYKEKGDHDGGIETFQMAVDKNPNETWIYLSLADILNDKKDYDGAIKVLTSVIEKGLYEPY
jgi:tetratricopeptide (TPR) repeat protein